MKKMNEAMENFIVQYKVDHTWNELTDAFNAKFGVHYAKEKIRTYYRRHLKDVSESEGAKVMAGETVTLKENGEQISQIKIAMTREQSKNPEYLLKAHGYNEKDWTVKSAVSNIWDGQTADGPQIMYQSKITVAPRKPGEINIDELIQAITTETEPVALPIQKHEKGLENLVIPLSDLHFGVSTYEGMKVYQEKILFELEEHYYKEVHIIILGDSLHSDSVLLGTTTKGTRITDVDTVKALEDARMFFEPIITAATLSSPKVFVHAVAGNHDTTIGYLFTQYLKAYFRNTDIVFDVELQWRTAFKIGNIMIGAMHGDMAKNKEALTLATEYPELWGTTKERYCFTGHLHHKKTTNVGALDANGMTLLQQPTPKPADDYELKNGFTLSKKEIMLYIFSDNFMEREVHIHE
ncbi:hypothetical protein NNG48_07305 [Enterococcus faecium]|nr:hypothetical protein [Enterococcus faecium]